MKGYIHFSFAALESIVKLGYKPGLGNRNQAANNRKYWEKQNSPNGMSAVYGEVCASPYHFRAAMYGNCTIRVSEKILENSTITAGDSLIAGRDPVKYFAQKAEELYNSFPGEYVEFQAWVGEIQPSQIEEIRIETGQSIPQQIVRYCEDNAIALYQQQLDNNLNWVWIALA